MTTEPQSRLLELRPCLGTGTTCCHAVAATLQVLFRDEASPTLLSGSADGQLAVFDLSDGLDEDDAFQVRGSRLGLGLALTHPDPAQGLASWPMSRYAVCLEPDSVAHARNLLASAQR